MDSITLEATARQGTGKGAARRARRQGRVPAVVYRGGEAATPVEVDPNNLEMGFKRTQNRNTLVELSIDGKTRKCLVREAQRHPVSRRILHVDFYEVADDQKVTVDVPVTPVGKAAGVVAGGSLRVVRRTLQVTCKSVDIPSTIDVDVTPVNVGQFVKVSQVPNPAGCEIQWASDFNVVACIGKRAALEEEEEAAAEAAPSEEGAEA